MPELKYFENENQPYVRYTEGLVPSDIAVPLCILVPYENPRHERLIIKVSKMIAGRLQFSRLVLQNRIRRRKAMERCQ